MKKRESLIWAGRAALVCLLLALFLVAPRLTPAASAMDPVELSFSLHFPKRVVLAPKVYIPFANQIEKRTKGLVKVKLYYAQSLAKTKDAYNAVVNGIADMTYTQHAHTPGQHPLVSVMGLPFLTPSTAVSTRVFHELYKKFPEIRKEHDDVHVLWLWSTLPLNSTRSKSPSKSWRTSGE